MQDGRTYHRAKADQPIRYEEVDFASTALIAIAYFNELAFRLRDASVVAYEGRRSFQGREYDVVLASWKTLEPQVDLDQYLVWVDAETKLIGIVEYTLRQRSPFIASRAIYSELKDVDGVKVPHRITAVGVGEESVEDYLYEINVESVQFDSFSESELVPAVEENSP